MLPIANIEHQLPGRVRLKIPSRRGDAGYFASLVEALSSLADVDELIAAPLTGGLILRHSGAAEPIIAAAAARGIFQVGEPETPTAPSAAADASSTAQMLDALAAGLSGLSAFQFARGRALGSASENFWNAFGSHKILENPGWVAAFAAAGIYQLARGNLLGSASSLLFYALMARQLASIERETEAEKSVPEPAFG